MNDLFKLFPELPRFPKRSTERRVAEVKKRAEEVRQQVLRAVKQRRAAAERVRRYWETRMTKRKRGG